MKEFRRAESRKRGRREREEKRATSREAETAHNEMFCGQQGQESRLKL
jgi:hypothetical protein